MNFSNIIKSRIIEYWENRVPEYVSRDIKVNHIKDMVTTIVGVRKCGKTFLTYQLVDELLDSGVITSRRQVCYLHFDDEQLMGFSVDDLHLIDKMFYSFFESDFGDDYNAVFIFDEIHKIKGWENFVLRIKKKPRTIVIVTGSSSDLEEGKVAKQLRGKTFTNHLYPLSFSEFLRFRGLNNVILDRLSPKIEARCLHEFDEYLKRGAFPAAVDLDTSHLDVLMKNYFTSIIQADFLLSGEVSNNPVCKSFVTYLLHNNGGKFTFKKTFNTLRSFGFNFSKEKIPLWYAIAISCYFLGEVPIFAHSIKKIEQNYRKIYCVDWALANAVSFSTEKRIPASLETMVYWELVRCGFLSSYQLVSQNKYEIDLIAYKNFNSPSFAIQICCDPSNQETFDREIRPFEYIKKQFPEIKCFFITMHQIERKNVPEYIIAIPIWKWLLNARKVLNNN